MTRSPRPCRKRKQRFFSQPGYVVFSSKFNSGSLPRTCKVKWQSKIRYRELSSVRSVRKSCREKEHHEKTPQYQKSGGIWIFDTRGFRAAGRSAVRAAGPTQKNFNPWEKHQCSALTGEWTFLHLRRNGDGNYQPIRK